MTFAATQKEKTMETPEQKERRREIYAYYKSQGRCIKCHKKDERTETVGGYCYDCLEKERARHEKRREQENASKRESNKKKWRERIEAGLCGRCGREKDVVGTLCSVCRARKREDEKRARIKAGTPTDRWNNGLCGHCVKKPVVEGFKLCEDCLARIRAINRKPPGENHPWKKMIVGR